MSKKDNRLYIELPSGWADQTVYMFQGPQIGDMEHSVTLVIDRVLQADSIGEMAFDKTSILTEGRDGAEVLKDEEITVEEGNPAWEFVYKWMPAENMKLYCRYILVMKDGMGFTFWGTFSKQTLKTAGAQMKGIIESLLPGTF